MSRSAPPSRVTLYVLLTFAAAAFVGCGSGGGSPGGSPDASVSWVRIWNRVATDVVALDHTPADPGDEREFAEQFGPTRTSRALAIVHIAIFEAANAIDRRYTSYLGIAPGSRDASVKAAIGQAAHDTLVALYPASTARVDAELAQFLSEVGGRKEAGREVGARAAAAILALRAGDGSEVPDPHVPVDHPTSDAPGRWRPDPVSDFTLALGAHWNAVTPFVLTNGDQFRAPPPPPLASVEYAAAFDEVQRLGGDGVVTPTARTEEQTLAGLFWGYDGTPGLGAPPRLYNQIVITIADERGPDDVLELARLLALVNVALADTGIAIWDSKYAHDFWRPVVGIREADPGTGPTGLGDENDATLGDPTFTPLGAPGSNGTGIDFTPPFPAYPSGHAGFGGATFQILRRFYGTDDVAFTFVSDELNGVTRDTVGNPRPVVVRRFPSLSAAEEENGQSRVYLGIHWSFDATAGIAMGNAVADQVIERTFLPVN